MANKTTKKTTKKAVTPASKTTKPVRKTTAAKTTRTEKTVEAPTTTNATPTKQPSSKSSFRFKKAYVIALLVLLLLAALAYAGRSYFIAATVNGQPISRLEVITELEKQAGQTTLDSLVTKSLILQEANKQNITVTDEQIDQEIKTIENNLKQQGQSLDQVLVMQGMSREGLREQVKVQKTVEVLLGREIVVTDQEVTDYIASNSASLPADMPQDQLKTSITQQLRQQKLSEKFQTWLQQLKQNASINYLVQY